MLRARLLPSPQEWGREQDRRSPPRPRANLPPTSRPGALPSHTTGRLGEPGWARSRARWGSSYFDRGLSGLWYEGRRRQPESPDAYSGWGEEPSGGAREAPAAQGSPGRRRRAAEPVAGHAPDPGPLHHRRRPEPAGRTPARLGPPAPRRAGAATRTLGVRATISARQPPPAPRPPSPRASGKVKGGGEGRKEGRRSGSRSRAVRGRDPSPEPRPREARALSRRGPAPTTMLHSGEAGAQAPSDPRIPSPGPGWC